MAITNRTDDLGELWMVEEHYELLPQAVAPYNEKSTLLEIGSWKGRSAILILRSNPLIKLYCLDIWNQAFDIFKNNIKRYGVADRVIPIKDWSKNVGKHFVPESLDFVYLDASHKEEDVYNDLLALKPLMKKDGVIVGDDWQKKSVRKAVIRTDFNLTHKDYIFYLTAK